VIVAAGCTARFLGVSVAEPLNTWLLMALHVTRVAKNFKFVKSLVPEVVGLVMNLKLPAI
jgi:hypothetical protein